MTSETIIEDIEARLERYGPSQIMEMDQEEMVTLIANLRIDVGQLLRIIRAGN